MAEYAARASSRSVTPAAAFSAIASQPISASQPATFMLRISVSLFTALSTSSRDVRSTLIGAGRHSRMVSRNSAAKYR